MRSPAARRQARYLPQPANREIGPVPRHREINEILARRIIRRLGPNEDT